MVKQKIGEVLVSAEGKIERISLDTKKYGRELEEKVKKVTFSIVDIQKLKTQMPKAVTCTVELDQDVEEVIVICRPRGS